MLRPTLFTIAIGLTMMHALGCRAQGLPTEGPIEDTHHPQLVKGVPPREVSGFGGIFFRAQAPHKLADWYSDHLGVSLTPMSATDVPWRQAAGPTAFIPLPMKKGYMMDHGKVWMVRFRVDDLNTMVAQLRATGISVDVDRKHSRTGRVAKFDDPEGNPLELWEPATQTAGSPNGANRQQPVMESVDGVGGFAFLAKDPKALGTWYHANFGILVSEDEKDTSMWSQEAGTTAFTPFSHKSSYFGDSTKQWMLDFRVVDLDSLVAQLRTAGISVTVDPTPYPYGRFARLTDPEGNPIELWEPHDPDSH